MTITVLGTSQPTISFMIILVIGHLQSLLEESPQLQSTQILNIASMICLVITRLPLRHLREELGVEASLSVLESGARKG